MAFIVEQYTGDRGIQLGCENLIRAMPWGANWNKIRIGCRVAVNGYASITGVSTTINQIPVVGFSQGAKGHLSNDCVDTVYMTSLTVSQIAIYTGTPPAAYYYVNGSAINYGLYQRVGSTSTNQSYSGGQITYSAVPTALRSLWYLEIAKYLTNQLTVNVWVPNSTQALINSTRGDFLKGLENEVGPANTTLTTFNTGVLSPSTRAYDHVFLGWSHAIPTACYYYFSVFRF
jgi:hypothetical protein